jgi:hypothetical protein
MVSAVLINFRLFLNKNFVQRSDEFTNPIQNDDKDMFIGYR